MAVLDDFSGGLNTRLDQTKIPNTYSLDLVNADVYGKALQSYKGLTDQNITVSGDIFNFKDEWISSNVGTTHLTWSDYLFTSDGVQPKVRYPIFNRLSGETEYFNHNLGIEKPEIIVNLDQTITGANVALPSEIVSGSDILGQLVLDSTETPTYDLIPPTPGLFDSPVQNFSFRYRLVVYGSSSKTALLGITTQFVAFTVHASSSRFHPADRTRRVYLYTDSYGAYITPVLLNANDLVCYYELFREYNGTFRLIGSGNNLYGLRGINSSQNTMILDSNLDISSNTAYNPENTDIQTNPLTFRLKITYVNNNLAFGTEVVESQDYDHPEPFTKSANNNYQLNNLPISDDPQVTHKKIYISVLGSNNVYGDYNLVAEIANSDDRVIISGALQLDKFSSLNNVPPAKDMISLIENNGVFYGGSGTKVYASDAGRPNIFRPVNSVDLPDTCTGLVNTQHGILCFTESTTSLLNGTDFNSLSLTVISQSIGCLSPNSINILHGNPLWVGHDGLCSYDVGRVRVISNHILGKIRLDIKDSVVFDEQLYLVRNDGTILVADFRDEQLRFYDLDFGDNVDGIAVHDGELYVNMGGKLNKAFDGDLLQLRYKSAYITEGSPISQKKYVKYRLYYEGKFNIKVYIGNELASEKNIDSSTDTSDFYQISTELDKGKYFQLEITGTGKISDFSMKPKIETDNYN